MMRVRILVIDGQGGRIGSMLCSALREIGNASEIIAVGTNSIATAAMLRAGASVGATGENPVVFNAPRADIIAGPVGVLLPNALYGEVTPAMASAVGSARAQKVLIPAGKCGLHIAGTADMPLAEYIRAAVAEIVSCASGQ